MNRPAVSRPGPRQDAAVAAHATARRPGGPFRILIADRDPELRRLVGFVLRGDGHEIVEAADGSELLEAIASLVIDGARPFDVIVSAQAIPGIPGISVLAGLRARGRRTPFVLMTGNPIVQAQARRLGATVLDRPFDGEAIRQAVRQADALANDR
jgi:two-component system response regulator MprA